MRISHDTLEILAETDEDASEVYSEWGDVWGVAFLVSLDEDEYLLIRVVDA